MKLYLLLAAAMVLAASTSCKKSKKETKYETKVSPVMDTELLGPGFSSYSRSMDIKVTFTVFNGCGQFDSFVESTDRDTLVVKVLARYPKDAFCTDDIPRRTTTFTKRYDAPGTYYIKWVGPGQGGPESHIHRDTLVLQ